MGNVKLVAVGCLVFLSLSRKPLFIDRRADPRAAKNSRNPLRPLLINAARARF